jgi:hypothetical protein
MLSRDASEDDCLNFVFPLQVNRANQQINEVVTLENDEALATIFGTSADELSFAFPINLLGADGIVLTIESNDALKNALDTSTSYCS